MNQPLRIRRPSKRYHLIGAALGTIVFLYCIFPHPPKEQKIIDNFRKHRREFEELNKMLQQDKRLSRLASWGVEMREPWYLGGVSGSGFSNDRYKRYSDLLKKVRGEIAWRWEGNSPSEAGIGLWGWGFAGNTRHINVVWIPLAPTNQIPTIDSYHRQDPTKPRIAYRQIEEHWYISTDW